MSLKSVKIAALKLTPQARGSLAASLLSSLEDVEVGEVENLWIEEAQRRYDAFLRGRTHAVSSKSALADAREALRQ